MQTLHIALKNGKTVVSKEAPYFQLIQWREKIKRHETVLIPTLNGEVRIYGPSVSDVSLDKEILTVDEAAAGMYIEPYTHYTVNGHIYQYSPLGGGFEKASVRCGVVHWKADSLPDGLWTRLGKDSIISARQLSMA